MRKIIMRNTNSNLIYILTIFFFLLFLSQDVFAYKKSDLNKLKNTRECNSCDLSNSNLSGTDLSGAILSGADLSGADEDQELQIEYKDKEDQFVQTYKKEQALRRKKEQALQEDKEQALQEDKEKLRIQNEKLSKQFDNVLRKIGSTTAFLPIGKEWGYQSCHIDHIASTLRKKPLYSKRPSLRKCVLERALKIENSDRGELFEGNEWYSLLREFVYGKASDVDKTNRYDKLEKLCGNCKEYTPKMILKSFCSFPAPRTCYEARETIRLLGIFEELDMHRQRCEGVKELHYHNPQDCN